MLSIKADFDRLDRILSDVGRKQLPFATALALNDTGDAVKLAEEAATERQLDNPTPFTRRGLYLRRASKRRLTAQVGFKSIQAGYLKWQVKGGTRTPSGRAILVPVGQRRNKYGNMPKGAVKRIAARADTFVAGSSRAGTGHLRPGIYKRGKGRRAASPELLVAFEPRASYRPKFRFGNVALQKAQAEFPRRLVARLKQAMATAR